MKKFIMAAAAAIMLITGVCVSASAEYPLAITYLDGYVTWEKASSEVTGIYNPTLVAAASENGQLTKVKMYKSESRRFFVNDDFYNGETVKFMLWCDIDGMKPMAQYIEETITGSKDAPVSVSFNATDFDCDNPAYENGYVEAEKLYFLNEGQTQGYDISDDVKLKVNGIEYSNVNEGIDKYIIGNYMSGVTLTDYAGEDGSLDGKYDEISVDYYIAMVVDECDADLNLYASIDALYCETGEKYWNINFRNKKYKFIKDGREIPVSDITADDVLLIKSDVTKDISDSASYETLVSSNVIKSIVTAYNEETGAYTVDGKEYLLRNTEGALEIGTKYKLYIDAFGKIAWYEELSPAKQLAVLDAVYTVVSGENAAKLVLSDGMKKEYTLRNGEDIQAVRDMIYADEDALVKKTVCERVVEYSLNQANELHIIGTCEYETVQDGLYQEKFKVIGGFDFSDETSFLNSDMLKITPDVLIDNYRYNVYAYDYDAENKVYRMMIVMDTEKDICAQTKMSVFKKAVQTTDENEDPYMAYILLTEGEEKTVLVEPDAVVDLTEGDAVLYEVNSDGKIKSIKKLFTDIADISDGEAFMSAAFENSEQLIERDYVKGLSTQKDDADLIFGVITYKSPYCIDVCTIENNLTDTIENNEISINDNIYVYEIDYNKPAESRIQLSTINAVIAANTTNIYVDYDRTIIDWSKTSIKPRLILAKTIDEEITEIYVIIPERN